jgi:hypothetical protein
VKKYHKASATLYLQEELSDARLRFDELKRFMVRALDLINSSKQSDKFYAAGGDIIHAIPTVMIKLEKALAAAALAVDKIDYEEIKTQLRPDKVDELEAVLNDVRIRMPKRTGYFIDPEDYNDE